MASAYNPYIAQRGLIAGIDAMEDEDSALFSDGGESLVGIYASCLHTAYSYKVIEWRQ